MSLLVRVTRHDGWMLLELLRHEKRNALNREMRDALFACLDEAARDMRVVVLTGAETSFCSGLDLKEREAEKNAGRTDTAGIELMDLVMRIREHPAVFVAAVNGLALGAGLTLVNACDLSVAASSAMFGTPEIGFATYAGMAGPTTQLTIARRHAAWLLLTGKRIDANTAERWGLVNEVIDGTALMDHTAQLAQHIAAFDRVALGEIKRALAHIPDHLSDWREAMNHGQSVNRTIRSQTDAAARGLAHFAQGGRNPGQG